MYFGLTLDEIPKDIGLQIQSELGNDWYVYDRGERIEMRHKTLGVRNDEKVRSVIKKIAENKFDLRIIL